MKPIYITQIGFSTLKDQKNCQGFFFFWWVCGEDKRFNPIHIHLCVLQKNEC